MKNDNNGLVGREDVVTSQKFMWFNRFESLAEAGETINTTVTRLQALFPFESVPSSQWFIGVFKELLLDEYSFIKEMESDNCEHCEFIEDDEPAIEEIRSFLKTRNANYIGKQFGPEFYKWLYDLVRTNDIHCSEATIEEFRENHKISDGESAARKAFWDSLWSKYHPKISTSNSGLTNRQLMVRELAGKLSSSDFGLKDPDKSFGLPI